ncbi:MAG: DUF58 domain-containing protein [Phycisphaerae bacterium]
MSKKNRSSRKLRSGYRFKVTGAGWAFLLLSVILGLVAIKTQVPLLFILFGGLMGVLHISGVLARRMIGKISLTRQSPQRVWQNQAVHVAYYLSNDRRWGSCMGLRLEEVGGDAGQLESAIGYCVNLPAGKTFRAGARFAAHRRGRLKLHGVQISTFFPFGLMRAIKFLPLPLDLVVWPAKGRLKARLLKRGATQASRSEPSLTSGGQDEFFGLREYRPDDNPRWIHWRRSAGRLTPVIREMSHSVPDKLMIVLDTAAKRTSRNGFDKREKLLRFAGTMVDHALNQGYEVGLLVGSADGPVLIQPGVGIAQHRDLLDALADVPCDSDTRLKELCDMIPRPAIRNAQVMVLVKDRAALSGAPIDEIRACSRYLQVLSEPDLAEVFEDDPHVGEEEEDPEPNDQREVTRAAS